MTTRTTSGVLAVVAGLLVVPGAAQAADAPANGPAWTTTSETTAQPPITETTTTTTVPTITAPAPPVSTPTTTATTPAEPAKPATVPRAGKPADTTDDAPLVDDSGGEGRAAARKAARAEKRREQRASGKAAKSAAKKEAAAKRKAEAKKKAKAKAKKDDADKQADGATTTTDDPAVMAQAPSGADLATELLEPGLAAEVPNFFVNQFKIPPFLLPIYQAAGIQYGIRWEILAAINEIETDYGRNLSISTAGAQGWMQFMPATWAQYGLDANGDDKADPYNPVDAIFSAARYLKAAGSDTDIRKAIFAYNHADWYVNSVLARARLISVLPSDLVGSLSGLTQGIFPVTGDASYVGAQSADGSGSTFSATETKTTRSAVITAGAGSDAVAVQDGTITAIGESVRLGKFIQMRDVYGNRYTYAHLESIAETYAAAKDEVDPAAATAAEPTGDAPAADPAPQTAASAGSQPAAKQDKPADKAPADDKNEPKQTATDESPAPDGKERVFANPDYAAASTSPSAPAPGDLSATDPSTVAPKPDPMLTPEAPDAGIPSQEVSTKGMVIRPLRRGSRVVSGTKLGTIAKTADFEAAQGKKGRSRAAASVEKDTADDTATDAVDAKADSGRMTFEVRPAGKGTPRIDPRPILDGWKLLQTSSVYAASGKDALFSRGANATAGQVLLMTKAQLQQRVLNDPDIEIYAVGREQIKAGLVDRRVLATLAYVTASGHKIAVSSLSRPGSITTSGNVSEHSSGNAVDIASVDGQTITAATQGKGSITDETIKLLLQLQGTMKPHQIISLMPPSDFGGASNILALPDHDDHIHVGFHVGASSDPVLGRQLTSALKSEQWDDLIARLGKITNPRVSSKPSKYALKTKKRSQSKAKKATKSTTP